MDSAGQRESLEQDVVLNAAEDDPATASGSLDAGHDGPVEKTRKFYAGKTPVDFDFHFPEEVWAIILNMLTEDADRTNCCRAFPMFDRLLTKSKPVWMFKQILPFLYDLESILEKNDMLTCRRICKQWCGDIEDCILPLFATAQADHDLTKKWYLFDSVEKIDSFNQTFAGHSGNPFINRTVSINNYLRNPEDEFQPKLWDLLSNYGEHIQTLEFNWARFPDAGLPGPDARNSYGFFRQVLANTTNLEKLVLWGNKFLGVEIPEAEKDEYLDTLSLLLFMHPPPPLPDLETLEILDLSTDEVPESFITMLVLPYANDLQSLQVDSEVLSQIISHPLRLRFPKLKTLRLDQLSSDQALEHLLLLPAPLKELKINNILSPGGEESINISALLRVLQNFPLLEEVEARIENLIAETSMDYSHLLNSNVRKFKLEYEDESGLPVSFNFLQAFKSLEELCVILPYGLETYLGRNEGKGELQFYKMLEEGQLYESNIWSLVPTLKTVTISFDLRGIRDGKVVGNRREALRVI